MMNRWSCLVLALLAVAPGLSVADEGLVLIPSACELRSPDSIQRLLAQRTAGGEVAQQVTQAIEWATRDPRVAAVADGVVSPVGDGEVTIEARVDGRTASARVVVAGLDRPF